MNTETNYLASRYRKLDRMVARIKEILQCIICLEIVGCPAVQCEAGHLMCGQCRDNLEENTCPTCRQPLTAVRNRVVEQVVEVLPKECPNAIHGCQELLDADEMDTHRVTCPFRQFSCPHPPCPWAGYKPELIGHIQDTHPQHMLFSNKQTVKVPVKWDEVSSWTMVLNDEILVLKFSQDRATNFLLGSFECLGQLNPVDSFKYHITVRKGDRETTLSGSIGPEKSAADRQRLEEWDNVFPRNRYDEHPCESSSSRRCINVDVAVEDNRRIGVARASVDVEVQTNPSVDVGVQTQASEAGGDTTRQVGGENQSDQTADRVIHELGSWLASGFYRFCNYSTSMRKIIHIIKETNKNIMSIVAKSIDDIDGVIYNDYCGDYLCIEIYLYNLSQNFDKTNIKMEHAREAGGKCFKQKWMLPYLLIVEQAVHHAASIHVHKFPAIDNVELEKLLTARESRMRIESALRMLRWAHVSGGQQRVNDIVGHMGYAHKKSEEEISSLQSDAVTIPWSDITTIS